MNNVLVAILVWFPLAGDLQPEPGADSEGGAPVVTAARYVREVYPDEDSCEAAKADARYLWTSNDDKEMLGTIKCTDGTLPTTLDVGTINITVSQ